MTDFFPLAKGATREYAVESPEGSGVSKTEILDVAVNGAATIAKCRRTLKRLNAPATVAEFTVTKDAGGVYEGECVEYKHPIKVGTEWIRAPRRFWIEALDAAVETPAGKFKNCLRVAYSIAEGDGGSGERYYAPGVGLVKIAENDEAAPFTCLLVALTSGSGADILRP
ncbi:MAG: hypothetical protein HY403_00155 [Elusimicrobia bacterium]|nr:hypothetical protein [Elusimicrobiota bacterium]